MSLLRSPSPRLEAALRDELLQATLGLEAEVRYQSLGTFELLVGDDGFWLIEANPRLQVEHTVTEEVTGIDLVSAQIRLAGGAALADVGLERLRAQLAAVASRFRTAEHFGVQDLIDPRDSRALCSRTGR